LQARVESLSRARGLANVYDAWTGGEIERAMAMRFPVGTAGNVRAGPDRN